MPSGQASRSANTRAQGTSSLRAWVRAADSAGASHPSEMASHAEQPQGQASASSVSAERSRLVQALAQESREASRRSCQLEQRKTYSQGDI